MIRGTLALFVRSLRVDSRLLRSYLFRFLFVGIIFWMLITLYISSDNYGAPGLRYFEWITWLNFAFITLAGFGFFSTVITEEKEELTLGLLRMAGMNPVSLLLGKMGPRLVSAVLFLSMQLPFTFLAITLGGVTIHQVLAAYCTLLTYLLLIANLGMLCSVVLSRSSTASSLTFFTLLVYFLGIPLTQLFIGSLGSNGYLSTTSAFYTSTTTFLDWVYSSLPSAQILIIMMTGFDDAIFGYQPTTNSVAACVLFGLSWLLFNRCTRNLVPVAPARKLIFRRSGGVKRLAIWRPWPHQLSLMWKDFHFVSGGLVVLIAKFIAYGVLLFAGAYLIWTMNPGQPMDVEFWGGYMMIVTLIILMAEIPLHVGRLFHEEIKWKTLSSLALLPMSTASMIYSKLFGSMVAIVPALWFMWVGMCLYPEGLLDFLEELVEEPGGWYAVFAYFFFVHMVAFFSLIAKWGAVPLSMGIMILIFMMTGMLAVIFHEIDGEEEAALIFMTLFFIGASIGLHVGTAFRFRAVAAR